MCIQNAHIKQRRLGFAERRSKMNKAELIEKLHRLDEVLLLELLELTSEDIVNAFLDRVVEFEERIRAQVEDV
jgi:hypothetical protein